MYDESTGVQAHIQSGSGQLREGLKTVLALVHKAQLPVTKKMRALLVEGSLLEDDLQAHTWLMHVVALLLQCALALSLGCAHFVLPKAVQKTRQKVHAYLSIVAA